MNTSTPKIDRRVQRTRQLLRDALMALIVEKGYDAISVQDITDHANVARPTFYLHYKDKEELLLSSVQEIYDDLAQNHPVVSYEDVSKEDLINQFIDDSDFKHVAEHIHFYEAMLSSKGTPRFIPSILEYLTNLMQNDVLQPLLKDDKNTRLPVGFMASFLAGAEIGVVNWWLKEKPDYSPQEMAAMMHHACSAMLIWALRLEAAPADYQIDDRQS